MSSSSSASPSSSTSVSELDVTASVQAGGENNAGHDDAEVVYAEEVYVSDGDDASASASASANANANDGSFSVPVLMDTDKDTEEDSNQLMISRASTSDGNCNGSDIAENGRNHNDVPVIAVDDPGPNLMLDDEDGEDDERCKHDVSLSLIDVMLLEDTSSDHHEGKKNESKGNSSSNSNSNKRLCNGRGTEAARENGAGSSGHGPNRRVSICSNNNNNNNSSQLDDSMHLSELIFPSRGNAARSSASRATGNTHVNNDFNNNNSNPQSQRQRGRSSRSTSKFNDRRDRRANEGAHSHSERQESSDNDLSTLSPNRSQNGSRSFHDNSLSSSKAFDASTGNMSHRERRALRIIVSDIDAELSDEGSLPRNSLHESRHSNGSRSSRRRTAMMDDVDNLDIPSRHGAFRIPGRGNNGSSSDMTDAATGALNDSGTITTVPPHSYHSSRQRVSRGKIDEVDSDGDGDDVDGSNVDVEEDFDDPTITSTEDQDEVFLLEAQLVTDDSVDPATAIDRARQAILYDAAVGEVINADETNESEKDRLTRMEEERRHRRRRRCIWCFVIVLVVVAVAAAIGAVVGTDRNSTDPNQVNTQEPTVAPTHSQLYAALEDALSVPLMDDFVDIEKILSVDEDSLQSPEALAFQWMTEVDQYEYIDSAEPGEEMVQRFVVASLYFEWTQGGQLFHLGNGDVFLSSSLHVCDWNGIDPDTDQPIGIFCTDLDDDRSVVTRIVMPRNNAGGSGIPTIVGYLSTLQEILLPWNRLSEPLSESAMGYLSNLRVLDLSSNSIPGMIPTTVGLMTSLEVLELDTNRLSSSLPSEIGLDRKLQRLDLFENNITSTIPSEIGQLTNVRTLQLNGNLLSGTLPAHVAKMTSLEIMILTGNLLSATIPPEIGSLVYLKELRLDANQHTGLIPTELGDLQSLFHLRLDRNRLTGQVPAELSRMLMIQSLVLYWNDLTGDMSALFCPTYYPVIAVDCGGPDPKITCSCCNVCCDSSKVDPDEVIGDDGTNSEKLYCI